MGGRLHHGGRSKTQKVFWLVVVLQDSHKFWAGSESR